MLLHLPKSSPSPSSSPSSSLSSFFFIHVHLISHLSSLQILINMEEETRVFLPKTKQPSDFFAHEGPELKKFRSYLRWVYVDQSNCFRAALSWSLFFIVAFVIPLLSHFLLLCSHCDSDHTRPYHIPVQISLSVLATLSFFCLSKWDRQYGMRKFLFLDKVLDESDKIQQGYAVQLQV